MTDSAGAGDDALVSGGRLLQRLGRVPFADRRARGDKLQDRRDAMKERSWPDSGVVPLELQCGSVPSQLNPPPITAGMYVTEE